MVACGVAFICENAFDSESSTIIYVKSAASAEDIIMASFSEG